MADTSSGSRGTPSKPQSTPRNILAPSGKDQHLSVRKIANGFIIRESGFDKNGRFQEKETFTKKQPKFEI